MIHREDSQGLLQLVEHLGPYQHQVETVLQELSEQRVMQRLWENDPTLWPTQYELATDRFAWLPNAAAMQQEVGEFYQFGRALQAEGYTHVLVLGRGEASLAATLFCDIFREDHTNFQLFVLDTIEPGAVLTYTQMIDPAHTLFLISDPSGMAIETLSLFKHFYNHVAATQVEQDVGRHFVALTDANSHLASLASTYRFRRTFFTNHARDDHYGALSYSGLIPAALAGVDVRRLLDQAAHMLQACAASQEVGVNPAARLGAIVGELARAGRDKATVITSPPVRALGAWLEHLLADSQEGSRIIPIVNEPLGLPSAYGDDRLLLYITSLADEEANYQQVIEGIVETGHPVVHVHLHDVYELGGQIVLWQMAMAVAAYHLGSVPFASVHTLEARQHIQHAIEAYRNSGTFPVETPAVTEDDLYVYGSLQATTPEEALHTFLQQSKTGDYVILQAYLSPPIERHAIEEMTGETSGALRESIEIHSVLTSLCARIRDRYGRAATFTYGPGYIHTRGTQHQDEAGYGLFIQLSATALHDIPIPLEAGALRPSLSFAALTEAMALGDRQALREAGCRLLHVHLGNRSLERLHQLNHSFI